MPCKTLIAALGQLRIADDIGDNVGKCIDFIDQARQQDVDIVCFPETMVGGYYTAHFDNPDDVDWAAVDNGIRDVRRACKAAKVGAALGASVHKAHGRISNVMLLIAKSGRVVGEYAKCHLMPSDKECYAPGQRLELYRFGGANVGLQICFDQRFPEPWRVLGVKGADAVFHGSYGMGAENTWKIPIVEAQIRTRAVDNGYYVVSTNVAGPFQDWGSVIYDPSGFEVARANYDREELVPAELDLSKVTRTLLDERRTDLAEIVARV